MGCNNVSNNKRKNEVTNLPEGSVSQNNTHTHADDQTINYYSTYRKRNRLVSMLKESNNNFNNIKSKYILKKIFDNLEMNKLLRIIIYNKKLQKRLNISVEDYNKCFSSIEIEILPCMNKYGKFINILNEEDKLYYHIFFNNKNEEIKRNYFSYDDRVEKIKIIIDYKIISFEKLFENCLCIKSINFKNFSRNNIYNMSYMFSGCLNLSTLNLSNFNTANVIDMERIFSWCTSLSELNLSKFNTNNVKNMSGMFFFCSSLSSLNLSNFNTNKVTDMSLMFSWCFSLKKLNISHFNTNKVTNMCGMFLQCKSLKELKIFNFNNKKIIEKNINMGSMFSHCSEELKNKIRALNKNIKENSFLDYNI